VADIEAYVKAHKKAGGGVDAEPREAGEYGWYAFVSDPQGAHFGVFQYAKVPA
jgi:predicted enzyme related to lactoylglutathione lyase